MSIILILGLALLWYAAIIFIAWMEVGPIAAIIVAVLIPIVLIFCVAMCKAAALGDRQARNIKKGQK